MRPRIAILQLMHETNTFSCMKTNLQAFKDRLYLVGDQVVARLADTNSEIAGFLSIGEQKNWDMVPILAAEATPSGRITREAWQSITEEIRKRLVSGGPWSGVFIALHGTMVTEFSDDADGDLLRLIRDCVGAAMPIMASVDLHANVSDRLVSHLNGLIAYRTYPHTDQFDCGCKVANLLSWSFANRALPKVMVYRTSALDGCDHGRTTGPFMPALLRQLDSSLPDGVLHASLQVGFPWSDVWHAGPSLSFTCRDGNVELSQVADSCLRRIWRERGETSVDFLSVKKAVAAAERSVAQGRRVVMADGADNPGGGAYGDATNLLAAALAAPLGRILCAGIWDPETADLAMQVGSGSTIPVRLGGKTDPQRGGTPIEADARVKAILEDASFVCEGPMMAGQTLSLGPAALLTIGAADIIVASRRVQAADMAYVRCFGVAPTDYSAIILKSLQHFRAAYDKIADQVLLVNGGGILSPRLMDFSYANVRRPIWPLDDLEEACQPSVTYPEASKQSCQRPTLFV